ncbi:hypothetical protein L6164_016443 [Bauhinia variegata]|uniref:Uncharacterized protein n=1 Tax=Bauhinia variegata TaxID=167791 RepID=A0ACB9NPZ4_BAUVA|nr:hypothetical protein L6164_016443 [Bauhinia variegata]
MASHAPSLLGIPKNLKFVNHFLLNNTMHFIFMSFLISATIFLSVQVLINPLSLNLLLSIPLFFATYYFNNQPSRVYLVDFACYKPEPSCLCTKEMIMERAEHAGFISQENLKLVRKIIDRSGLGPETYVADNILEIPPKLSLFLARKEAEMVIFGAIDELLAKTGIEAKDIGILVVNCSIFNPTPSFADMIVNRYKLRGNILCYSLSGMGCSAGVIAIDLAKRLLQSHPNSYALVVSTENGTSSMYWGNNPSMLLTNCLFRMGGSAVLLSSHSSDHYRSKYQLIHTLRTHMGADDTSYNCVLQGEDEENKVGVALSKSLMDVAREALKAHITLLGPLVLPLSEKLKFLVNLVGRKLFKMQIKAYMPDFKLAFQHFCIHPGGRAVLDRIQKSLELDDWYMEPSRMTLYRFGNTSSSSLWYEMAYCEAKGRIKKGDIIWQLAFGSGFKCNSAVWLALYNDIHPTFNNAWTDEIHKFPISVGS